MTRKSIRNYTTKQPVRISIKNIEDLLRDVGARNPHPLEDFKTREFTGIQFQYEVLPSKIGTFKYPVKYEPIIRILLEDKVRGKRTKELEEQSKRIAWKNTQDEIDIFTAKIREGSARFEEAFYSYLMISAKTSDDDIEWITMFESFNKGLKLLSAGDGK